MGGVLFLLVAVLLTTMAIIHSRRKDSKARNGQANYCKFISLSLLTLYGICYWLMCMVFCARAKLAIKYGGH